MSKQCICTGLFWLTLSTLALNAHAETPDEFAYRAALAATPGLNVITLNESVYRAAQSGDLRDLRVFNGKGESLPLARLPAPRVEPGPAHELHIVPLPAEIQARDKALADYKVRIEKDATRSVIELTPAPAAGAVSALREEIGGYLIDLRPQRGGDGTLVLHFAAEAPDFTGRVDILGSDDLYAWRTIASGPLVRNRQLGDTVERNRFVVAHAPSFVRVAWSGAGAPRIESAELVEPGKAAPLPRTTLTVTRGETKNAWLVDVPLALPIALIRVRPAVDNVSVRVRIFHYDEAGAPRPIRHGLHARRAPEHWIADGERDSFRLNRDGQWIESSWFAPAGRTTQLRIDAVDAVGFGDSLPIVEVQWLPERYLVAASEPGPYVLTVGNDSNDLKPAPALDARSVLAQDDAAAVHVPIAALADVPLPEGAVEQKPQRIAHAAAWSRYVLWGVLLAAVLGLAVMALRIATQLKRGRAEAAEPDQKAAS